MTHAQEKTRVTRPGAGGRELPFPFVEPEDCKPGYSRGSKPAICQKRRRKEKARTVLGHNAARRRKGGGVEEQVNRNRVKKAVSGAGCRFREKEDRRGGPAFWIRAVTAKSNRRRKGRKNAAACDSFSPPVGGKKKVTYAAVTRRQCAIKCGPDETACALGGAWGGVLCLKRKQTLPRQERSV